MKDEIILFPEVKLVKPLNRRCPECHTLFTQEQIIGGCCPTCVINVSYELGGEAVIVPERVPVEEFLVEMPVTAQDIIVLGEIKALMSDKKKEEEKFSKPLKQFMIDYVISSMEILGVKMTLGVQDRGAINEDWLVLLIRNKIHEIEDEISELSFENVHSVNELAAKIEDFKEALVSKTVTDPDKVIELINKELISGKEMLDCKIQNDIYVFKAVPPKQKKSSKKGVKLDGKIEGV